MSGRHADEVGADGEQPLFSEMLAHEWARFVDCERRSRTMVPFLRGVLNPPGAGPLLDLAAGIGCEACELSKLSYMVTANEVDEVLRDFGRARTEAIEGNVVWTTEDWRSLTRTFNGVGMANVLLLGNSFCLLLEKDDCERASAEIAAVCARGCRFVIDERNFRYFLREKRDILRGHFRYTANVVYCGNDIVGKPIAISHECVTFGYFDVVSNALVGALSMRPFGEGEVVEMFKRQGFSLLGTYSDLIPGERAGADFYTYVFEKC